MPHLNHRRQCRQSRLQELCHSPYWFGQLYDSNHSGCWTNLGVHSVTLVFEATQHCLWYEWVLSYCCGCFCWAWNECSPELHAGAPSRSGRPARDCPGLGTNCYLARQQLRWVHWPRAKAWFMWIASFAQKVWLFQPGVLKLSLIFFTIGIVWLNCARILSSWMGLAKRALSRTAFWSSHMWSNWWTWGGCGSIKARARTLG